MKSSKRKKPALSRIYVVVHNIYAPDDYENEAPEITLKAYVTERSNLVSEVDTGDNTELHHLQKCEGWQWDAFLVYCKAKELEVKTLTQYLRAE